MKWPGKVIVLLILATGLIFLIGFGASAISGEREPKLGVLLFSIVFLLIGVFLAATAFVSAVILTDDEILLRDLFGTMRLPFDKIRGRRRYLSHGDDEFSSSWYLKLESNDDRFPTLEFAESSSFDEAFYAWLRTIPDLDEADKKNSNFGLV